MVIDRYVKAVLTVIAAALTLIALHPWVEKILPASAEAQQKVEYIHAIPKAWGKVIGYSSGNLLLEAPDGTLREADLRGKPPEYPKVKSMSKWE